MNIENLIAIPALCTHYKVELSFFNNLSEMGLLEVKTIEETQYIHPDAINEIEKMIRIHQELDINTEGIDVVFNLLQKIDALQNELNSAKNRLRLYES
ncbi:chaperone modulator CbpM [Flavobacterium glaciei]|uniref:MerR-like DNA binding protein n=1 Tax=Flavobacterium glaciei TaxID=386300 RepID=A0A562PPJ0_9FLAO|nr:chaperone modulator CbpM [Flavobacterium glaciei]RDI52495.1 MerR-like DNA binding protein [Flavobacterium glaciei]TWI46243.1 MerR-like DNA binding protein [Flavobacterium glaciei]